jgi:hypothetical protein
LINLRKKQQLEVNKTDQVTQEQAKNFDNTGLTLSEEDALKAQIFGCWSIPLGLPYNENLLVRIKLELKPDGSVSKSEILDHARMNRPGQGFYKVLAESALRAVKLCQPLRVPTTGYERWKELQLNFDARRNVRRLVMKNIKFILSTLLIILLTTVKSFSLIEVDITRGNLNPLPVAVSSIIYR